MARPLLQLQLGMFERFYCVSLLLRLWVRIWNWRHQLQEIHIMQVVWDEGHRSSWEFRCSGCLSVSTAGLTKRSGLVQAPGNGGSRSWSSNQEGKHRLFSFRISPKNNTHLDAFQWKTSFVCDFFFLVINQFWMTVDCILLHMFFVREYVEICRCILMSLEYSILPTWETSDVLRVLKRSVHSIQGAFSVFLLACTNTNVDDLHVNYRTLRWLYIILFSHLSFTWSDPENGGSTDPPIMRARIT